MSAGTLEDYSGWTTLLCATMCARQAKHRGLVAIRDVKTEQSRQSYLLGTPALIAAF
jgi:hypothetical protein